MAEVVITCGQGVTTIKIKGPVQMLHEEDRWPEGDEEVRPELKQSKWDEVLIASAEARAALGCQVWRPLRRCQGKRMFTCRCASAKTVGDLGKCRPSDFLQIGGIGKTRLYRTIDAIRSLDL
jgi:hypothetical protein